MVDLLQGVASGILAAGSSVRTASQGEIMMKWLIAFLTAKTSAPTPVPHTSCPFCADWEDHELP